jgi:hypothetical protein
MVGVSAVRRMHKLGGFLQEPVAFDRDGQTVKACFSFFCLFSLWWWQVGVVCVCALCCWQLQTQPFASRRREKSRTDRREEPLQILGSIIDTNFLALALPCLQYNTRTRMV